MKKKATKNKKIIRGKQTYTFNTFKRFVKSRETVPFKGIVSPDKIGIKW